jgi:signal transduction histidine kinase
MPTFPLPENEDDRIAALQTYAIFDTGEEPDYDALTSLASAICQIPIVLITFIDEKRQWFKSHHGTDFTENLREYSFCTHAIASGDDFMLVPDATVDERFSDNPMVTGPTKVVFYAGVPLVNEDGYALGTLCMIDQQTHSLSPEQVKALKTLAKQVVDKVELRRKVMRLEKANQELLNSNVLIQKFATMAAHDIKNPLSSILLTSQALKIRHEKLQDEGCMRLVDLNITSTKNLLSLVDDMLEYSKVPSLLIAKKRQFDLSQVLNKIISMIVVPDSIVINLPAEKHHVYLSPIAFEQIMINLLSNAIRYNNKENGIIQIRFSEDQDFYYFEVEDNGMGIAEQYHEKIFSNNFTLKITDRYNQKGTGIGLTTVKELLHALEGNIFVRSVPGEGATFFVTIKK